MSFRVRQWFLNFRGFFPTGRARKARRDCGILEMIRYGGRVCGS